MSEYYSDTIMNALVEATKDAGHQLSFKEAEANKSLPTPNKYASYWGTYDNAARLAWNTVKKERGENSGKVQAKLTPAAQAMLKKK